MTRKEEIALEMQALEDQITALQDKKALLQAEFDATSDTKPGNSSGRSKKQYGGIMEDLKRRGIIH